jgi:hypothetical protein
VPTIRIKGARGGSWDWAGPGVPLGPPMAFAGTRTTNCLPSRGSSSPESHAERYLVGQHFIDWRWS